MKIMVLGGGGREHALVWALKRNKRVKEVICAPGNGGIAALARCIPVDLGSLQGMLALTERESPDLVVVGPEVPLAEGIVNALNHLGVKVFGPTKQAARLETSKAFAKDFMRKFQIPTAKYLICKSLREVEHGLKEFPGPVVVKADGLAAGKGVVLCESATDTLASAEEMFSGRLLGSQVEDLLLEEMLTGPEISFFAICDGDKAVTLALAQDHKRVGEADTGPNTGGMGAYSTDALLAPEMQEWVSEHIAQRVVDGMKEEGTPFVGVLFIGLMMTSEGPKVLEFNTRFGDPETEAILLRLETDLLELFEAAVEGRIREVQVRLKPGASACVVAASGGYPGSYTTGEMISGLGNVGDEVEVFHAGTKLVDGEMVTAGGRVLAVAAVGEDLPGALRRCYAALERVSFAGMHFRRDIGWRASSITHGEVADKDEVRRP